VFKEEGFILSFFLLHKLSEIKALQKDLIFFKKRMLKTLPDKKRCIPLQPAFDVMTV
jgi:hypothetical protein